MLLALLTMEQETSNNLEDSNVKREMPEEEQREKVNLLPTNPEVRKRAIMEVKQCTEPEILEPCLINHNSDSKGDCDSVNKDKWMGKQKMEQVMGSSSDEEASGTPEKTPKRRKKRSESKDLVSQDKQKKMQQIHDVLSSTPLDLEALRKLAIEDGGLVKDELRRKAWPCLMMIEHMEVSPKPPLDIVKVHKDYQQVVLDVKRSLKRFPPGIDDDYRVVLMDQLTVLIIRVLMKHPDLHYYQGFHDVAITFLLVMGEDVGFELVEKLSITHLSEFMRPTMEKTTYYLTYIYPILHRANPELYQFLVKSGVGTVFCLPWLITWFAHTLSDYRNVVRLYDFFLASPYLMPMYIAAAIVLLKKEDIMAGECEMAMQHFILSQVPDSLPFEDILVEARKLYEKYLPDTLQEEVEEYLKKKEEEENMEKQLVRERKKKFEARKLPCRKLVNTIFNYIRLEPVRRQKLFKIVVFAATVYVARSLYSYYSTSAIDIS
ncbi:TBC1 domain family member 20 [Panulirus ornatus]|uniref:TBC1 domain family member 20 n=1 Tax=Panulirus ornatus TaxID=150431 RepID=UPI003A839715